MQTACSVLYWYDVSGLSFFLSQVCCNAQTRQIAHLWPGFCWGTHNAASLVPQSAEMGPSPSTPLVPTLNQSRLLCSALLCSVIKRSPNADFKERHAKRLRMQTESCVFPLPVFVLLLLFILIDFR